LRARYQFHNLGIARGTADALRPKKRGWRPDLSVRQPLALYFYVDNRA